MKLSLSSDRTLVIILLILLVGQTFLLYLHDERREESKDIVLAELNKSIALRQDVVRYVENLTDIINRFMVQSFNGTNLTSLH